MKLREDYVLREVAGVWVVLPIGEATLSFNGMISLNETGVLLWKVLEQGADREAMADALTKEYIVDRTQALNDVSEFLGKLTEIGCLEI